MKAEKQTMRYGGPSDKLPRCTRCGKVDGHGIKIYADPKTTRLARQLQDELDKIAVADLLGGRDSGNKTKVMVGAAIARIGSQDYGFVTISGSHVEPLSRIGKNTFGNNVDIVKSIQSPTLNSLIGNCVKVLNPAEKEPLGDDEFPPGACCAQKLLMAIFEKKKRFRGAITSIRMSEIMWRNSMAETSKTKYGTNDPVPSCGTCKKLVPLMLCDIPE